MDSRLIIGTPLSKYYSGELIHFPVSSDYIWSVELDKVIIDDLELADN